MGNPVPLYLYQQHEKEELFNRVSSFIETNDLNPLCFTINSQWIKDNMNIFGKHMLSSIIDNYIKSSKHRWMVFERYSTDEMPESHRHVLHNIIKIYKFLRSSPTRYNVPISATFNYTTNSWKLHPGATRISVLNYINVSKITLITFNGVEKLNHIPGHVNMRELDFNRFKSIYRNVKCKIIQYKEFSNYFEISEDHRLVKNFTDDMTYRIEVRGNRILVNKVVCFERDSENLWVPILENIRQ